MRRLSLSQQIWGYEYLYGFQMAYENSSGL